MTETPEEAKTEENEENEEVTRRLPEPTLSNPNVVLRSGKVTPWRPARWNRSPGPIVYEYDWFDWLVRLVCLGIGLLIGFLAWHGIHFTFST